MASLLLRLVGPMQSWGTQSRFDDRDSGAEPSKSGVLGLCAAALGIDREAPIDELAALHFGVRVDREGVAASDYHTAQLHPGAPRTRTDVTRRAYLADAAFWAGLEGDSALLGRLYGALRNPCWPLALGRKSFQASLPIFAEPPQALPLLSALLEAPSLRRERDGQDAPYRLLLDREALPPALRGAASPGRRQDQPGGPFASRRYQPREVLTLVRALQLPRDRLVYLSGVPESA